jgi:hypothetical protein
MLRYFLVSDKESWIRSKRFKVEVSILWKLFFSYYIYFVLIIDDYKVHFSIKIELSYLLGLLVPFMNHAVSTQVPSEDFIS